jgi:hypothetical protein
LLFEQAVDFSSISVTQCLFDRNGSVLALGGHGVGENPLACSLLSRSPGILPAARFVLFASLRYCLDSRDYLVGIHQQLSEKAPWCEVDMERSTFVLEVRLRWQLLSSQRTHAQSYRIACLCAMINAHKKCARRQQKHHPGH